MEIPIQNVYYLLCYAWNKLEEQEQVTIDVTEGQDLLDLLVRVLNSGTTFLFKKGLDRDYLIHRETLVGIKGKLLLEQTLKSSLLPMGKTHCAFDEFSYDVLHNQILKSVFRLILKARKLDKNLKKEARFLFQRFHQVSEIPLSTTVFRKVQLHRDNQFYYFLLKTAELIYHNLLPTEKAGEYEFADFTRNKKQMAYLFESFLLNFYKQELKGAAVHRENIRWDAIGETTALNLLPKMQTDISIEFPNRKLIIDAKFYKNSLQKSFNTKKFHSKHMYQMRAYLDNVDKANFEQVDGLLLYPTVGYHLNEWIQFKEYGLGFRTIDLGQEWRGIRDDLLMIIKETAV